TKRKYTSIKLTQKIEICKIKSTNSTIKNVELASRYGVGESTITDILKKQHHYLSLSPNNYTMSLCREKPSKYPAVKQALALWIDQVVDGNCSLSGHIVIQKAVTFAQCLGIQDFKGSNGWFDRFKKCYGIRNYLHHGKANSVPLEDLQQYLEKEWQNISDEVVLTCIT
ncbi:4716_t:CDS:2, partial [Gigaspora rosea]